MTSGNCLHKKRLTKELQDLIEKVRPIFDRDIEEAVQAAHRKKLRRIFGNPNN